MNQEKYIRGLHKIGTTTMMILLVTTFIPPLYIYIVYGCFPGWTVVAATFAALFAHEIATWIMEPMLYFPMVGVAGSYICFTSGNITSMRIPCAIAAQNAVDARSGTAKGDAAGVFGMVGSVVVNFVFLCIVIFFGGYLLKILPDSIRAAFNYAMPAVYGALIIMLIDMFAGILGKKKK